MISLSSPHVKIGTTLLAVAILVTFATAAPLSYPDGSIPFEVEYLSGTTNRSKCGFETFTATTPPQKYLVKSSSEQHPQYTFATLAPPPNGTYWSPIAAACNGTVTFSSGATWPFGQVATCGYYVGQPPYTTFTSLGAASWSGSTNGSGSDSSAPFSINGWEHPGISFGIPNMGTASGFAQFTAGTLGNLTETYNEDSCSQSSSGTVMQLQGIGPTNTISATSLTRTTDTTAWTYGTRTESLGNRLGAAEGGDQFGANLRYAAYGANLLNQYTNRTVPSFVNIIGTATNTATVTVNDQLTYRKGDYYRAELSVTNGTASAWMGITNIAVITNGTEDIVTNKTGNLFIPQTPETFKYDADGNLTNDGRWSYTWDAENRLVTMTANTGVPSAAKLKLDLAYDYRNRRTTKKVSTWNGSSYVAAYTNKFLYDDWNLIAELNQSNGVVRTFLWGTDLSGSLQGAGGVGGLLAITVTTNGTQFPAFDGNGNVSSLVSAFDETRTAAYDFGPFGEVLRAEGSAISSCPIRFSSKYQDTESDFIHYLRRYYNAKTGAWLTRDPVEERDGPQLYGFVSQDPIQNYDPFGLFRQSKGCNWKEVLAILNAEATAAATARQGLPLLQSKYHWSKWNQKYPGFLAKTEQYGIQFVEDTLLWYVTAEGAFQAMIQGFAADDYDVECECFCLGDKMAYTYPPTKVIHFCPEFFQKKALTQAQTFLHEFSHIYYNTFDYTQGGGPPYGRLPRDAHWYNFVVSDGPDGAFHSVLKRIEFLYPE